MSTELIQHLLESLKTKPTSAQQHWDCYWGLSKISETDPEFFQSWQPGLAAVLSILFSKDWVKHQYLQPIAAAQLKHKYELEDLPNSRRLSSLLSNLASDRFFLDVLEKSFNVDWEFECFLKKLRHYLLTRYVAEEGWSKQELRLAVALAVQAFNNEYIVCDDAGERKLVNQIEEQLLREWQFDEREIALSDVVALAMYKSPTACLPHQNLMKIFLADCSKSLRNAINKIIFDPIEEKGIAVRVGSFCEVKDHVSLEVRAHYEENPFPRWLNRGTPYPSLQDRLANLQKKGILPNIKSEQDLKILVAGCGTGQQPIGIASGNPQAQILAVDLSRSSLAYAQRMANHYEVRNIQFLQGDLLQLSEIGQLFHHVECVGVLHCLREPVAGWHEIKRVLLPGGTFHGGLYSSIARLPVQLIRNEIEKLGLKPSLDDMKELRRLIMSEDRFISIRKLINDRDFYNLSMLRDFLFHTHEYCYTLAEVGALIEQTGFEFLGFSLNQAMAEKYLDLFSQDPHMGHFENWQKFEPHYIASREMFYFWLQNPSAHAGAQ